ncbi:MAG: D-alanyl-D-alanine carboxypeptidase/D-alanyl-D-alanine-endopeptidase [Balneolaceae bacterium]
MNRLLLLISTIILVGLAGCKSAETISENPSTEKEEPLSPLAEIFASSEVFNEIFTGFALYDPDSDSTLYSQYADKYFTPASNTKLFTFYAGLKSLPDSLKGIEYVIKGDSLIFWGTGDPTFLHPDFESEEMFNFLKNAPGNLYYSDENFKDDQLGPGWAWGDYQYYYSTEKTPFPIYGNVVRFTMEEIEIRRVKSGSEGLAAIPDAFRNRIESSEKEDAPILFRDFNDNTFEYKPETDTVTYTVDRPFHYTPELFTEMLSDTLGREVSYINMKKPELTKAIYSSPVDTVYKRMLQPSDNFLAEQLLFVMASEQGKNLNSRAAINELKSEFLDDLPDEPIWRDGSGLSRYNLFTPRSIVKLLKKIDDEFESDVELFSYFPVGGKSGTIKSWYAARSGGLPYVFAKTGTLSNNHCLSGYVITKSGKKLLFSFMNNHYISSSNEIRIEMEKVLWHIHENF